MRKLLFLAILLWSASSLSQTPQLDTKDFVQLVVSSYVHGFKEFDTSVVGFEDSVSVGIYYDPSTQDEMRAKQLAERFKDQIPELLARYRWGQSIKVVVSTYAEDRATRGYSVN